MCVPSLRHRDTLQHTQRVFELASPARVENVPSCVPLSEPSLCCAPAMFSLLPKSSEAALSFSNLLFFHQQDKLPLMNTAIVSKNLHPQGLRSQVICLASSEASHNTMRLISSGESILLKVYTSPLYNAQKRYTCVFEAISAL